ncbi:NRDE family protein [Thiohalocapsa marina]|uniref:NRDE family protein n=1 Tax=Thiohalocapsa marina TaxID=424902 RepID=A0A5M8FR60_9GAMM|nr:NRDE family protein [Thiohalocapsa marina]KAA6183632.1 NRDE family protein [Thiohalocapsa marina]
MCTLVILYRPGHDWPLLLAANRDEWLDRPSRPPGRHWEDRPEVLAGLDLTAGGSWLGLNDHGVVAAVLNRQDSLGPLAGKRSRGELVLEALDHAEAGAAVGALADLSPEAYRPFNLLVADPRSCYWVRHAGDGIRVHPVSPGLHMLASGDLDDPVQPRIARFLPRFRAAATPDPESGDWSAWIALLQCRAVDAGAVADSGSGADDAVCADVGVDADAAMNLSGLSVAGKPFGTRSSTLIALPAYPGFQQMPILLHADGPPDQADFLRVG